jgi:hypothetical protein
VRYVATHLIDDALVAYILHAASGKIAFIGRGT